MHTHKFALFSRTSALGAIALLPYAALAQSPLAQWTFDEGSPSANVTTNFGATAPGLNLTMYDTSNVAANLRSLDELGVDGVGRALDLTSTAAMGTGTGARAQVGPVTNIVDYSTLTGLTVTGWFKIGTLVNGGAQLYVGTTGQSATLVRNYNTGTTRGGFQITTSTNPSEQDSLRFTLGTGLTSPTVVDFDAALGDLVLNQTDIWVFFAVTWDKNLVSQQLKWYVGDADSASAVSSTKDYAGSIAATTFNQVLLGRSAGNNGGNGFDGLLDDIRVYGSALDATGVENVRLDGLAAPADLASVPTPTDGEEDVSSTPSLSWTAGSVAASLRHRVYFGTDSALVTAAGPSSAEYKGEQAGLSYVPSSLVAETTYYWRVDEVIGSHVVTKGNVWSFTTVAAPADPYADWAIFKSLSGNDALPNSDPDKDGIQNLIEYAIGGEPGVPSPFSVGQVVSTGPSTWVFRYTRPENIAGITSTVKTSPDLVVWTAATQSVASTNAGIQTMEAVLPASTGSLFARLEVIKP